MQIWMVNGSTESGDDWSMAFAYEPEKSDIIEQIMADPWLKEEYEAECIQGWHVISTTVIEKEV
jgi:hypothetical protein